MAHLLTTLRLGLAAPLAIAFARPDRIDAGLVAALLTLALVTDLLDGPVARRRGAASPAGRLFDHGTDCVFVTAGLAGAALAGQIPPALPVLTAAAFVQYAAAARRPADRRRLRAPALGRWNGIGYFAPLVLLAASRITAMPWLAAALTVTARAVAFVLIASTLAAIADRATAGRRAGAGADTTPAGPGRSPGQPADDQTAGTGAPASSAGRSLRSGQAADGQTAGAGAGAGAAPPAGPEDRGGRRRRGPG